MSILSRQALEIFTALKLMAGASKYAMMLTFTLPPAR